MKKIENIFIWTSIIFLIGIVGFFSYRFIHYYRLSHNRDVISNDLYEIILDNRAILNLRKVDNSYYYTENNGNNYVIYSGILWRIIKLENNKLTLISDVPVTNLYYDDVLDYLNNEFYNLLDNRLIVDTETCINSDEKNECIEKYAHGIPFLDGHKDIRDIRILHLCKVDKCAEENAISPFSFPCFSMKCQGFPQKTTGQIGFHLSEVANVSADSNQKMGNKTS